MSTLFSVFCQYADQTPRHIFLVEDSDRKLSYAQAFELVNTLLPPRLGKICPSLLGPGPPCPPVVLLSPNNPLFVLTTLALWRLSAPVVPINPKTDPSLWAGMIELVSPQLLVVASEYKDQLLTSLKALEPSTQPKYILNLSSILPEEFIVLQDRVEPPPSQIAACLKWLETLPPEHTDLCLAKCEPDANALGLFTSSAVNKSTIKCVMYTHRVLHTSSLRTIAALGGEAYASTPQRHLGWMSLSHCFEFCISFSAIVLQTGGTYVFYNPSISSPSHALSTPLGSLLLDSLVYHQPVSSFCSVPSVIESIIDICTPQHLKYLQTLNSLVVGGAASSSDVFSWALEHGIKYYDLAGATEVAGTMCIRSALVPHQRLYGLQVIDGLMGVLRKNNLEDDYGELILCGYDLPRGYESLDTGAYKYDPTTKLTVYYSGDLYSHDTSVPATSYVGGDIPAYDATEGPLSGLTYLGRVDDMVVLKSGVKVNALDIENRLNAYSMVTRVAVISSMNDDSLVALIELKEDTPTYREALTNLIFKLNATLSYEKRFHQDNIIFVSNLPLTTKGTLNRKKLKLNKAAFLTSNRHSVELQSLRTTFRDRVVSALACALDLPPQSVIETSDHLFSLPLTSLVAVSLANTLKTEFHVHITAAHLYGINSLEDLCNLLDHLQREQADEVTVTIKSPPTPAPTAPRTPNGFQSDDIVITGVSCRFVGGIDNLTSLWKALLEPDEFLSNLSRVRPLSRWASDPDIEDKIYPMGWLGDELFGDAESFSSFFGLTPRDVENMSPNARLALKLGYEAIEDAGIAPTTLNGKSWGVFTAVNDSGWGKKRMKILDLNDYAEGLSGNADDAIGARLSYFLNLTGPTMEIKSACSSSAVAIHQACNAIRLGDCQAAVVISSVTQFDPAALVFRASKGIVSKRGVSSPYSNHTDGYVAAEGAAAIILQRADQCKVNSYGRIKATTVTQDGRSRGFFAPNPQSQKRLLETALLKSGFIPEDISLVEGHGTGTPLGDAIELQALKDVYGSRRTKPLYLGSIKAAIGHTEECAGLAGLLKTLCCLQYDAIPPQPTITGINDDIDFSAAKLVVPQGLVPFLPGLTPRVVAISSFGLSGTLAQLIIEDPPVPPTRAAHLGGPHQIFAVSARNKADFIAGCKKNLRHLSEHGITDLTSFCRTSLLGRDHFPVRYSWVVSDVQNLSKRLEELCSQPPPSQRAPSSLGIWFGLPVSNGDLGSPDHQFYFNTLLNLGWAQEYEYFRKQFAIVTCLEMLGCQITAVAGEGLTEIVAGAYTGMFDSGDVFPPQAKPSQTLPSITLRRDESELEEDLLNWRHDELHIIRRHGPDCFTLQGTPEALAAFSNRSDISTHRVNEYLCHATHVPSAIHTPRIPVISSYLGEILDETSIYNKQYWSTIHTRRSDSLLAWNSLRSKCDVILNVSDSLDIEGILGEACLSTRKLGLQDILCHMYNLGHDIKWHLICPDGTRSHIPTYSWALDLDLHF